MFKISTKICFQLKIHLELGQNPFKIPDVRKMLMSNCISVWPPTSPHKERYCQDRAGDSFFRNWGNMFSEQYPKCKDSSQKMKVKD